jgi:hypothetical protein
MEFIEKVTTSGLSASSVTFNSGGAWADYQDLLVMVKWRIQDSGGGGGGQINLNGSASNLSGTTLYSVGSNPLCYTHNNGEIAFLAGIPADASLYSTGIVRIPNINDTSNNKQFMSRFFTSNSTTSYDRFNISVNKWSQTAAVTSITFKAGYTFTDNSTFALYGLRSGSGGGTINIT